MHASIPHLRIPSLGRVRQHCLCPTPRILRQFGVQAHEVVATRSQAEGDGYWTLQQPTRYELEVKKSKFIVTAFPASTPAEAQAFFAAFKDTAASHNCCLYTNLIVLQVPVAPSSQLTAGAYAIGGLKRCSDDGEPSGTAGRPILGAIESESLQYTAVLVTRFFGGTKLGAGGLVRAYGASARSCLRGAPRVFKIHMVMLVVRVEPPYDELGSVNLCLAQASANRVKEQYLDDGVFVLQFTVAGDVAEQLVASIMQATRGRVLATVCAETLDGGDDDEVDDGSGSLDASHGDV